MAESKAENWTVRHDPAARRFEVALGNELAVLNYRLQDKSLVITHTKVPPAWEGRGIAASLTRAAFDYARAEKRSVVPVCSYAAAYLHKHPEYSDLKNTGPR
jgi:predicted GNAT family acetyltransferase